MKLDDVGSLRPFLGENDEAKIKLKDGSVAPAKRASLTEEQWRLADAECQRSFWLVAQLTKKLVDSKLFADFGSDPQPLTMEHANNPAFTLPLPTIYFQFSDLGPNMVNLQAAARRVGQKVELMLLDSIFEHKLAVKFSMDCPLYNLVEKMCETMRYSKFYGPYLLIHSYDLDAELDSDWDQDLTETLRNGIRRIVRVEDVVASNYISGRRMAAVQLMPDVIRMAILLKPTLIQWEDEFRVVAVMASQIRNDFYNNVGIVIAE